MGKLESKLNEERIRQQRVNIEILISKDKNIRINITTCIQKNMDSNKIPQWLSRFIYMYLRYMVYEIKFDECSLIVIPFYSSCDFKT